MPLVALETVALGSAEIRLVEASINSHIKEIDGLLGMSFLGDFRFEIDRTNKRLTLRPPQNPNELAWDGKSGNWWKSRFEHYDTIIKSYSTQASFLQRRGHEKAPNMQKTVEFYKNLRQKLQTRASISGLPLRFLQCVLQTLTEPRRSQGDAHSARDRFKQFEHALVDFFEEAELHDGIHAPIGKGRRHDQMPRCFAAERRSDLQVAFGQVGQRRRSRIRRDLSKQPFARPERFGHSGLIRHAKHRNSIEGTAFALEERTGDRVRAIGEECQNGRR